MTHPINNPFKPGFNKQIWVKLLLKYFAITTGEQTLRVLQLAVQCPCR